MATTERVVDVGHAEIDRLDLARCERLRLLETVAELAAQGIAAHQLLVAGHGKGRFLDIGARTVGLASRRVVVGIDVDQFHDPVGIGAAGGDEQARFHRPAQGHVFFQRFAAVGQHVGAARGKALVAHHVFLGHADGRIAGVRHRLARIGHVFVEAVAAGRRLLPRQGAVGAQVQGARLRLLRWPGRVLAPDIAAGLEGMHFRLVGIDHAFQVLLEERKLDIFTEVLAGLGAELHAAQALAVVAAPGAVRPWPHHQAAVDRRIIALDRVVGGERAL